MLAVALKRHNIGWRHPLLEGSEQEHAVGSPSGVPAGVWCGFVAATECPPDVLPDGGQRLVQLPCLRVGRITPYMHIAVLWESPARPAVLLMPFCFRQDI